MVKKFGWVSRCTGIARGAFLVLMLLGMGAWSQGSVSDAGVHDHDAVPLQSLPSVSQLFPSGAAGSLDGRLLTMPCAEENSSGTDCATSAWYRQAPIHCSGGALNVVHDYPVAGNSGTRYNVTVRIWGIVEAKNYGTGVTRETTGRPANTNTGSPPTPFAWANGGHTYPPSDYNTYEIRVYNPGPVSQANEVRVYYLNADTQEGHWTYVLNYQKPIQVVGGGTVRVRTYDRNCRQIKNCGPSGTPANLCGTVANQRIVSLAGADPMPTTAPAPSGGLMRPNLVTTRSANASGQWLLIDVVSVDSIVP